MTGRCRCRRYRRFFFFFSPCSTSVYVRQRSQQRIWRPAQIGILLLSLQQRNLELDPLTWQMETATKERTSSSTAYVYNSFPYSSFERCVIIYPLRVNESVTAALSDHWGVEKCRKISVGSQESAPSTHPKLVYSAFNVSPRPFLLCIYADWWIFCVSIPNSRCLSAHRW